MRRQKLVAGDGGRGRAEEHPDDRADRRRQDRDRAPPGAAGAVAVPQGRGVEVHRGRLRRARRRVDGPRPGRDRGRHGARGADRRGAAPRPSAAPRSGCSTCCCRRRRPGGRTTTRRRRASRRSATRERLREQLRDGPARRAHRRDRRARAGRSRSFEIIAGLVGRGGRHQPQGHAAGPVPGAHQEAAREGARGAASTCSQEEQQKLVDMESVARDGGRARRGRAASSSSTRSTRSPGARAGTGPTSAARACSATSCRSSRARRSTRSTGWCGPTTSCSSRPARSTCRSRRT